MGDFADPAEPIPIGVAHGAGWMPDPSNPARPPWATFRLTIAKVPPPGRWAPVGRESERVEGADYARRARPDPDSKSSAGEPR